MIICKKFENFQNFNYLLSKKCTKGKKCAKFDKFYGFEQPFESLQSEFKYAKKFAKYSETKIVFKEN